MSWFLLLLRLLTHLARRLPRLRNPQTLQSRSPKAGVHPAPQRVAHARRATPLLRQKEYSSKLAPCRSGEEAAKKNRWGRCFTGKRQTQDGGGDLHELPGTLSGGGRRFALVVR
jgi:hypothetical protein